jgi:UDP-N-acetyl-D-mannosaminuronate dehydrogenase
LRLHGSQDLAWLGELLSDAKRQRIRKHVDGIRRPSPPRTYRREADLHLVPVQEIDTTAYAGFVYSLETAPTNTFATSHGVLVHNCIPVDPQYLAWRVRGKLGHQFRLLETADDTNQRMPAHVVQRSGEILNDQGKAIRGAIVLVLGVAYKGGSADTRESPSLRVVERLLRSGAEVQYHDPYVPSITVGGVSLDSRELTPDTLRSADLVLVLTDHPDIDYPAVAEQSRAMFDTRGVTWGRDLGTAADRVHRS